MDAFITVVKHDLGRTNLVTEGSSVCQKLQQDPMIETEDRRKATERKSMDIYKINIIKSGFVKILWSQQNISKLSYSWYLSLLF